MKKLAFAALMAFSATTVAHADTGRTLEVITSWDDYSGRGFSFADAPSSNDFGPFSYIAAPGETVVQDGFNISIENLRGSGAVIWYSGLTAPEYGLENAGVLGSGWYNTGEPPHTLVSMTLETGQKQLGFNMMWDFNPYYEEFMVPFVVSALGQNGEVVGTVDFSTHPDALAANSFGFRGFQFNDGTEIYGLRFESSGFTIVETAAGEFTSAVPEADTWAMMIMGFGLVGTAMRRRRNQLATA